MCASFLTVARKSLVRPELRQAKTTEEILELYNTTFFVLEEWLTFGSKRGGEVCREGNGAIRFCAEKAEKFSHAVRHSVGLNNHVTPEIFLGSVPLSSGI